MATDDAVVHDVVLTDEKGEKKFGTCLCLRGVVVTDSRLTEQLREEDADLHDLSSVAILCLLSTKPNFHVSRKCLLELWEILKTSESLGEAERYIWWLLHNTMIPPRGCLGTSFTLGKSNATITFEPHTSTMSDTSLLPLFRCLGVGNIVSVSFFVALLSSSPPLMTHPPPLSCLLSPICRSSPSCCWSSPSSSILSLIPSSQP